MVQQIVFAEEHPRGETGEKASALGAMEVEADNKPLILNRVKFKVVLVGAANGIV